MNQTKLTEFLSAITDKITSNFDVDEIVLFGSYAKGTASDISDIDVAVSSPEFSSNKPCFDNAIIIAKKTKLYEPYLQLMPFSSEKYYGDTHIDPNFIREIKRTGKTIYTRSSGKDLSKIA